MLEKMVPIPPEFYDDHKDDDLITGKGTIFPFAVFLYFMQWAAFLGFILFYWYHPSSQVTQSKLENTWDAGKAQGWNCTPLLNDPFFRIRMNYDSCKELMLEPKLEDIKTLKINIDPDCVETDDNQCENATAFRFVPFNGFDGMTGKRGIVQPGSLIDNTIESTNKDAIKAELKKIFEPLKSLGRCDSIGFHWKNKNGWGTSRVNKLASFDIFVDQMKKKDASPAASPGTPTPTPAPASNTACCGMGPSPGGIAQCGGSAVAGAAPPRNAAVSGEIDCELCASKADAACSSDPCPEQNGMGATGRLAELTCPPTGRRRSSSRRRLTQVWYGPGGGDDYGGELDSADPTMVPGGQAYTLSDDGTYDFGSADPGAGMFFGPGGETFNLTDLAEYGFDTSDGSEYVPCSITKEETVDMFKKYLTTHDPCVWAQHNSPYMCTKTGPPAPSAVFSLAYANALLAYSIFSAVCVQIFFASSKKKKAAEAEAAATETPATVHPAPGELKVGP